MRIYIHYTTANRIFPFIIILLLLISQQSLSQNLELRDINVSYRVFEIGAAGNNPTTIGSLLKDPNAYHAYLKTITYNLLSGHPAILQYQTFYLNAEWYKPTSPSRIWKRYTLLTGLLVTTRLKQEVGSLASERVTFSPDSVYYLDRYSLVRTQQFFGGIIGVNRRFNITRKLQFQTGLQVQGSFALVHHYNHQWDSMRYVFNGSRETRVTHLSPLKGKNFLQWQLMIPIGFEYAVYKNQLLLRLEGLAGIVGGKYRPRNSDKEALGAGISFIYRRL